MATETDVIRLVHRADWTRLSLLAELNDGSRLLLAPGRRYRKQTPDGVRGCDGERPWRLPALDEDRDAHWIEGPEPPLPMLLCPAWLLRSSRLEVRGHVTACGRDALHVIATERPSIGEPMTSVRPGRTEALVDAELGILLRVSWLPPEDEPPEVTELVSLELDPVTDPAQFAPPPGSVVAESWSEAFGSAGPLFAAAKTAAGLAAAGLGAWIKHRPQAETSPADAEAAMPQDDPAPEMSPDGRPGPRSVMRSCGCCTTAARLRSTRRATSGSTSPPCCRRCRNRSAGPASAGWGCWSARWPNGGPHPSTRCRRSASADLAGTRSTTRTT